MFVVNKLSPQSPFNKTQDLHQQPCFVGATSQIKYENSICVLIYNGVVFQ